MYFVYTMEDLATRETLTLRFTMLTLGIGALLALILSAVGLFAVLSYVVAQRTHAIGVRMALGAQAGRVQRIVLMRGTRVVAVGVSAGPLGAFWGTRTLSALLFGVEPLDPTTFVAMSAGVLGVGLLATARRRRARCRHRPSVGRASKPTATCQIQKPSAIAA